MIDDDYGEGRYEEHYYMGDMADYYGIERDIQAFWPTPDRAEPARITRASKWTTRSGLKIAIKDLETDHLQNILNMHANGRLQVPDAWLAALQREAKRR